MLVQNKNLKAVSEQKGNAVSSFKFFEDKRDTFLYHGFRTGS